MTTPDPIIVLSADGDSALSSKLCDASSETRKLVDYKERLLFATAMHPVFERLGLEPRVEVDMEALLHDAPPNTLVTYLPDEASKSLSSMLTHHGCRVVSPHELMVSARTPGTLVS